MSSSKMLRREKTICVTTTQKATLNSEEVFDLLETVGIRGDKLQTVQSLGPRSFDVTFLSIQDRKLYGGKLSQLNTVDVRVYGSDETIVTATRIPAEYDDNYVRTWLSQFGVVKASRMVTYRDRPTVQNGNRQYKMTLKPGCNIPSSWRMVDGRIVFFRYVGQPRTCIKCNQEGHEAAECTVSFCNKCLTVGHGTTDCTSNIVCNICSKTGHSARKCPLSFANRLQLDNKWSRGTTVESGTASTSAQSAGPSRASNPPLPEKPTPRVAHDSSDEESEESPSHPEKPTPTVVSDSSDEESGEGSEVDKPKESEPRGELFLEPTPDSSGELSSPLVTSKRRRRRGSRGRKSLNPPSVNLSAVEAEPKSGSVKEGEPSKPKTKGTPDERESMEVTVQSSKRSAPSDRSDEELRSKRKPEPLSGQTKSLSSSDGDDREPLSQKIEGFSSSDLDELGGDLLIDESQSVNSSEETL